MNYDLWKCTDPADIAEEKRIAEEELEEIKIIKAEESED